MNKITDEDLVLLYYGEHENPQLAAMVAESEALSARFDELSAELGLADAYRPPHRGSDYGAEVWQRISPQLVADDGSMTRRAGSRLGGWLAAVAKPRFSLAGALSIALIAVLAFQLGRNQVQDGVQAPAASPDGAAIAGTAIGGAEIDSGRLLTHSVSTHLEQMNLMLTQFVNSKQSGDYEAGYATDMLVANRLYRQAAAAQGNHKLAAFLADLEPLLIELAYDAQSGSPATRERMQAEVENGLLFRVRVMNRKLNESEISV